LSGGPEEKYEKPNQDIPSSGINLNPGSPECEIGVLISRQLLTVGENGIFNYYVDGIRPSKCDMRIFDVMNSC
jgi:hypothetical protein